MLKFSQATGFVVTTSIEEAKNGEEFENWRERIGYGRDANFSEGTRPATYNELAPIRYYKQKKGNGWLVEVDATIIDGAVVTKILVDDEAELFALRTKISPPVLASMANRFESIATIAEKAFRAWHGHASFQPCEKCDPETCKTDRELRSGEVGG